MRILILVLFVGFYAVSDISTQQYTGDLSSSIYDAESCNFQDDISLDYRVATYDIIIPVYKAIAVRSNFNCVFSPTSIWIMLAAIAEGAEPVTQQKLFSFLNLPNDPCIRLKYYQLASTRAFPSNDVNIKSTRAMLIDEGLTLNSTWYDFVVRNSLLEVVTAPIRYNPAETANQIKRIMSARIPTLNLNGNSVLLDAMDYSGLWTTAFADATIERAPFYNLAGEQIGSVDLMRVKRRARMGYVKSVQAKVLELPIGLDGRYRVLFLISIGNNNIKPALAALSKDLAFEIFDSLRLSYVQLDIAIPRMVITSEIDVRNVLEDLGVSKLWTDPAVTRYISEPPAFPSSFVQRATLVLNNDGITPPSQEQGLPQSIRTGLDPILGRDFIANKPFLFGLFDADTVSCQLAMVYTQPTYT